MYQVNERNVTIPDTIADTIAETIDVTLMHFGDQNDPGADTIEGVSVRIAQVWRAQTESYRQASVAIRHRQLKIATVHS